ncbi:fumarylacetoacetate hydrolase family protein [Nocardia sp. NBC_00881]|uniref:fumarylacetoacetate hydrolase family protein n=1 Tax=Nocardia sp. NBC_00881 TaxID=2975995 RepID=UPI0038639D38|nr:fumarylacetoacetate hydrolase family protein [Nocardia sp. NBC_00881]
MAAHWKADTAEMASRGGFDSDGDAAPAGIVLAQASRGDSESMPWLVANGRALPLREWADEWPFGRTGSLTELLEHWPDHESGLRDLTTRSQTRDLILARGDDIGSLLVRPPMRPRQMFCAIGNYVRQVVEAAADAGDGADGPGAPARRASALEALHRRGRTGEPYVCLTSSERVGSPIGNLSIAPGVETLDWEVEIAVVFGAPARRISPGTAASVIAGYCVANDLTVRSRVVREDLPSLGSDWIQSKGMPGSLPLGPWFVPAWQVPDPPRLRLQLSVNGIVMQNDTAEDMLFGIEHQIAYLARHTSLRPGDVLCTGSPAGFGVHHGRFLAAGDVVTAQVSGLGEQRLVCVAEELPEARVAPRQATEKEHMR